MADGLRFEKSSLDQARANRDLILETAFAIKREYAKALRAELIEYLQSEDMVSHGYELKEGRQELTRWESREFHQNNMRLCADKLSAIKQAMISDFLRELNKLTKMQVYEHSARHPNEIRVTLKTTKRDLDISITSTHADRYVLDIDDERWEDALFEEITYAIAREVER